MYIFKQVNHLQGFLTPIMVNQESIGFVPTMGALHEGHLGLIESAANKCDWVVCSIFINPTQFNDPTDLLKYPRTPEKDIDALINQKCDILFFPDTNTIYPPNQKKIFDFNFNGLENRLEGAFRPGHFQGVAEVVHRLLSIVRPHSLFMGQKDYQQVQIVKKMIDQSDLDLQLHTVPTVRNSKGLALSSRNRRLSEQSQNDALIIFESLSWVKENIHSKAIPALKEEAIQRMISKGFKVDYFEVVDPQDMLPISEVDGPAVACTAAWIEGVRLIDNMLI